MPLPGADESDRRGQPGHIGVAHPTRFLCRDHKTASQNSQAPSPETARR
jgi:hypothetical protein